MTATTELDADTHHSTELKPRYNGTIVERGLGRTVRLGDCLKQERETMNRYAGTELEKLASKFDYPVEVDGHSMNVNIQGEGERAVVLLQGRGTTAPALDFQPLTDELIKQGFKVIVPEFFGSGLSDMTDKPRTPEQIVNEVHEALSKLGITTYDLAGHSLAGIQALEFANSYPNEVQSFTGIDTATPGMSQFVTPELENAPLPEPNSNLSRYEYSPEQQLIMAALEERNKQNDDVFTHINKEAGVGSSDNVPTKFPDGLPVHFFLSGDSVTTADTYSPKRWYVNEHVKQVPDATGNVVTILPGEHYLHQNQAAAIAEGIAHLRAA